MRFGGPEPPAVHPQLASVPPEGAKMEGVGGAEPPPVHPSLFFFFETHYSVRYGRFMCGSQTDRGRMKLRKDRREGPKRELETRKARKHRETQNRKAK